ncbi:MAG: hypothetical protein KGI60_03050, partial [Patescibacteria group bacterium]|nr:hypothetical protein [Patescibacteria group bacterium]
IMRWEKTDKSSTRTGFALKINGVWHVAQLDKGDIFIAPEMQGRETPTGMRITQVIFGIVNRLNKSRSKQLIVIREE